MNSKTGHAELDSQNTLKGLSALLSEVRVLLDAALVKAEDRLQQSLSEAGQKGGIASHYSSPGR